MNTKQLFFISLIILSVAMGMNWFKNRPARPKKKPNQVPRQAVSLSDLQIQDDNEKDEDDEEKEDKEDKESTASQTSKVYEGEVEEEEEGGEGEEGEGGEKPEGEHGTGELASGTTDVNASDSQTLDNPLKDDPIMKDYFQLTRNPFETSPYAQLVEKLRIEAELAARPKEEIKEEIIVPKIMNARFTGTIETARGPKAIVDGSLYEKGNELNGCIVKEIKMNMILLESGTEKWLLPKTGVDIKIDPETGDYSVTDTFD